MVSDRRRPNLPVDPTAGRTDLTRRRGGRGGRGEKHIILLRGSAAPREWREKGTYDHKERARRLAKGQDAALREGYYMKRTASRHSRRLPTLTAGRSVR